MIITIDFMNSFITVAVVRAGADKIVYRPFVTLCTESSVEGPHLQWR